MTLFDMILFIVISAFIARSVEDFGETKKPKSLALIIFNSLMLVGYCIEVILRNI